jgi:hypothetical protein
MNYITKNLKQTISYWENLGAGGIGYSYANAIEIPGRWQDKQELFIDENGREQLSNAIVYVDRDVVVGDYLYLGNLDDLGDSSSGYDFNDPSQLSGSYEIKAFKKTPNLQATIWERKIWL